MQAQDEIRRLRSHASAERSAAAAAIARAREAAAAAAEHEDADGSDEQRPPLSARNAPLKAEGKPRGGGGGPREGGGARPLGGGGGGAGRGGLGGIGFPPASGLFKAGMLPDSFSLDEASGLVLHEPPTVLRATEPETDEELLQARARAPSEKHSPLWSPRGTLLTPSPPPPVPRPAR